jgi:uncharacterized membrane protein
VTSTRERLGWALLFSVPVGAGVALGTVTVTDDPSSPYVVGSGVVAAAVLFAFVYLAASTGSTDDDLNANAGSTDDDRSAKESK